MKHIKKKFLQATQVGEDVIKVLNSAPINKKKLDELEQTQYREHFGLMLTEGNELIQSFRYLYNGQPLFIPEPNPIVIYFETARHNYKSIEAAKNKIVNELGNVYTTLNNFFTFYGTASICGIFLFNSIEAFINGLIPHEYVYHRISPQKTESFNRSQIQATITFEEKIKTIIPEIKQKSFHIEFSHKYESIKKLKEFRDAIMHTKSDKGVPHKFYQELYNLALDFNYKDTLEHVKDFLNYYENNLIEECNCGKDF